MRACHARLRARQALHPRRVREWNAAQVLSFALAVLDAAAGAYFIRYAVRRERRDKDGVMAVVIFLVICAGLLVLLELLLEPGQLIGEAPPVRQL